MTQFGHLSLTMAEKYLVVGAGITGSYTAAFLKQKTPDKHIEIWEKSRGGGGRMSTSRPPVDGSSSVDLGAQYISATPFYFDYNKSVYDDLINENILKRFTGIIDGEPYYEDGTKHFVAPHGVSSITKHILKTNDIQVKFDTSLSKLNRIGGKWEALSGIGEVSTFDHVILTMPVPQILGLQGDIKADIDSQEEVNNKLKNVSYSSRFAIGLFYDTDIELPWDAKYYKDPVIRFVSVDDKKRGFNSQSKGSSICVHASVPFTLKHLEEDKEQIGMEYILPAVQKLLPNLPVHCAIKCHKWRYSQVYKGYSEFPYAISLDSKASLIFGGDGFAESSKFDHCIHSAKKIIELLDIDR